MKRPFELLFLVMILAVFPSCKKNNEALPTEPVNIDLTSDQLTLVRSGNDFAFDIFRRVSQNAESNIIISPLSISVALSMAVNGANNETRTAMLNALLTGSETPESINKAYQDLTKALLNIDKRVLISLANSMWIEDNFPVKKDFKDILTEYYSAEGRSFDINDSSVPGEVNNWIENKTNGLIKNMLESLDPQTAMLLVNAIYFKGQWSSKFDKSLTAPADFYKTPGEVISVPMMNQESNYKIFRGSDFTVAELPYGQGNYVMDVILPDENKNLNEVIQNVSSENFNNYISNLHEEKVKLSFPKFKYGYKKELKDILSDMGMGVAFTESADFSNISDIAVMISFVLHQAMIETNEEGSEAAAATIIGFVNTSMPAGPVVLNLDRPFMYIIRETSTNSILFMGRLSDPLAK
jgi:serpin B